MDEAEISFGNGQNVWKKRQIYAMMEKISEEVGDINA